VCVCVCVCMRVGVQLLFSTGCVYTLQKKGPFSEIQCKEDRVVWNLSETLRIPTFIVIRTMSGKALVNQ